MFFFFGVIHSVMAIRNAILQKNAALRDIAQTGVHYISVGALTHSATSVDIALDFSL